MPLEYLFSFHRVIFSVNVKYIAAPATSFVYYFGHLRSVETILVREKFQCSVYSGVWWCWVEERVDIKYTYRLSCGQFRAALPAFTAILWTTTYQISCLLTKPCGVLLMTTQKNVSIKEIFVITPNQRVKENRLLSISTGNVGGSAYKLALLQYRFRWSL